MKLGNIPLAVGLVLAWLPSTVQAHGYMSNPPARSVGQPNQDYQYCYGQESCVCGEYSTPGPIRAVYSPGQTIQITLEITQGHDPGLFYFQLCATGSVSQACFAAGQIAEEEWGGTATGTFVYNVALPPGLVCDPCVLRWKWSYAFLSCTDIRISSTPIRKSTWGKIKALYASS